MRTMLLGSCVLVLGALMCVPAPAQVYNANAGGWNTGYGTVYGSFGLAQATQNIYNSMQINMQRAAMRQAMINKWGKAAVERAERNARSGTSPAPGSNSAAGPVITSPPPVPKNYGSFRPDKTVDTGKAFADALGESPDEKAMISSVYANTKAAYEREVGPKGWTNNVAGGLTFFTVTAMTVYHDGEEPSEEAVNAHYEIMKQSIDDLNEFASITNREKQQFNNVMIGFSGLLLAGYMESKQNNDADAIVVYRRLAGELIKMVLKVEPDRLKIKDGFISMERN